MTTTILDTLGRVTEVDYPDGSHQKVHFNAWGEAYEKTGMVKSGESDYWSTSGFDDKGRLTWEKDPKTRVICTYPDEPIWKAITSGDGNAVEGTVFRIVDNRNNSRYDILDLLGALRATITENDEMVKFQYDAFGNLSLVDNNGQQRKYEYNGGGWLVSRTEPEEGKTVFSDFTPLGSPRGSRKYGLNSTGNATVEIQVDARNRPTRVLQKLNGVTQVDRLYGTYREDFSVPSYISEVQPNGRVLETYDYDSLGRVKSRTIQDLETLKSFRIERTLDALGNPVLLKFPGANEAVQTETREYDSVFRLKHVKLNGQLRGTMEYRTENGHPVELLTLGNGASTTQTFENGQVSSVKHVALAGSAWMPTGIETYTVTWDPSGRMTGRGSDAFGYDAEGRLNYAKSVNFDGFTIEQWFAFDRYGNRTVNKSTPSGTGIIPEELMNWTAVYNQGSNRTNQLPGTVTASNGTSSLITGAVYDNFGRITDVLAVPNNQTRFATSWGYDPSGRVIAEQVEGVRTQYVLDGLGLRFKRINVDGSGVYTVYGFDREPLTTFTFSKDMPALPTGICLTSVNGNQSKLTLQSSQTGNLLNLYFNYFLSKGSSISVSARFANGRKLSATYTGNGYWQNDGFGYEGSDLDAGPWTMEITSPNSSDGSVVLGGITVDVRDFISLDPLPDPGIDPIDESNPPSWSDLGPWVPSGTWSILDGGSSGGRTYAWVRAQIVGFGKLLSEETPLGPTYNQSDQVGSPNILTDRDANVIGRTKNLPFGERFVQVGAKSSRRYTNHEDQPGSAIYMQARMYLPAYGRFAEVDPKYDQRKFSKETWNLYGYVANNPVTMTDPTGEDVPGDPPGRATSGKVDVGEPFLDDIRTQEKEKALRQLNQKPIEAQKAPADNAQAGQASTSGTTAGANGAFPAIPPEVGRELAQAVTDSNSPNGTDKKGGFHEEGLLWGTNSDGKLVVVRTLPGPTWKRGEKSVSVDYQQVANYQLLVSITTLLGKAHVHSAGDATQQFVQEPSTPDKESNFMLDTNIVVGAGNGRVYSYNSGGVTAETDLTNIVK